MYDAGLEVELAAGEPGRVVGYQHRLWPRSCMLCAWAKLASVKPGVKSKTAWPGSMVAHFIFVLGLRSCCAAGPGLEPWAPVPPRVEAANWQGNGREMGRWGLREQKRQGRSAVRAWSFAWLPRLIVYYFAPSLSVFGGMAKPRAGPARQICVMRVLRPYLLGFVINCGSSAAARTVSAGQYPPGHIARLVSGRRRGSDSRSAPG